MKIKIETIPDDFFPDYRLDVIFEGYKWDFQEGHQSTISNKVVLLDESEADFLSTSAVKLYNETILMEQSLRGRPDLALKMGISEEMVNALCNSEYNPSNHIRFMRFDFHPTTDGWQISEVNSDVPAGYPEASVLPELALKYFDGYYQFGNFGDILVDRLVKHTPIGSTVAYVHDTHIVEDYQILRFIGDLMERRGYKSIYADPSHIKWLDNEATGIGAIVRYFPVEWMEFTKGVQWRSFINSKTLSCNHPVALLTQSKRLPLVWDELNVEVDTWKKLLPKTKCFSSLTSLKGFILKPAFGRVGEGINIPKTLSTKEDLDIKSAAKYNPSQWVAQEMFESTPINGLHLNLGVFVVDGKFAGLYARGSEKPRIDSEASEMPVLVGVF